MKMTQVMPGAAVAALLFFGEPARAEWEAAAFGVSTYNTDDCECNGEDDKKCSDSSWFTTYAETFQTEMQAHSYDQVEKYTNAASDPADFVDVSLYSYGDDGNDPLGTDFADVIFNSSHGSHTCSSGSGWRSGFFIGDHHENQTCFPRTNSHLKWGNSDADMAIIFNCQSAHYCVWQNAGYSSMDSGSFTTLLGFHGDMWLTSTNNNRLENYLEDSASNGVGENWVDGLTNLEVFPWEPEDQCATAIIWGSSSAQRDDQYEYGGLKDFHDTGSHTGIGFYYIDNCNPQNGETL